MVSGGSIWRRSRRPTWYPDDRHRAGHSRGPAAIRSRRLARNLRHRALLLVLDNCEHLIATCAELADACFARRPVADARHESRSPERVGEIIFRVPSLSLPEAVASVSPRARRPEATQLFVERAAPSTPPSHRHRTTRTPSPASASVSMGFRSPSSWRPPAPWSCRRSKSRRACRTDSACSPAARDRRSRGTGHSRRPWTGVTSCSRSPNASCSAGCQCSRLVDARSGRACVRR